ncbi:PAS domain-containing sensor histidine kinase [Paraburkholderia sp. DHOC27]|uniref:hybrid sensor histidine kinase/response regulator n=1 Tax=Paraburkholderia sp. DHOC27 TaxID=2303330 RepID=UPI000E3D7299|nr:hybrid sensor histidine kinase/response regulator [Paraburkholderia sp. DHOC27]RFU44434.1 response regulator [Paraburkholderia sp. DHOC27]
MNEQFRDGSEPEQDPSPERTDREVAWYMSRDLLAILDRQGIVCDVNPAWPHILGRQPSHFIGQHLTDLAGPADVQSISEALASLKEAGASAAFEARVKASDDSYRFFSWSVTLVRGQIFCAARDITVERRHQLALEDSRDFARLALSAVSGVGVWTYEVSSDCFFCDAAISEVYGIDAEQAASGIRRDHFLANVHPDDRDSLRNTMSGGLLHGGDLELEYRICHPDGSVRFVLSRGHTYFSDDGLPVRRTGVGIDMTSQRELEQQLRQSQKMEAVGHLTGGIAHDFNNMLQGVIGPLELIQHLIARGKPGELDRFIAIAVSSARRAAALTHRLLAFSRRQPLAPQSVNIRELIPSLDDLIRQTATENVSVSFVTEAQPCMVRCDPNQLESALLNLAINARDAMPNGGRLIIAASSVWISEAEALSHDGAHAGRYVRISVSDTGLGMTPDVAKRVLEPFFTTKAVGQGTGLGLSMVDGFVRQSGGFVSIKSTVGKGTEVSLLLPQTAEVNRTARDSGAKIGAFSEGAGETLLVVDDDETIRLLLAELFVQSGYKVISAHDGPSGLALLTSDAHIDLLVSDVRLPGLNGRQMADAARVGRPDLPVLFVTGYAEEAASDGFLDRGMQMLTKPFSIESVLTRVRGLLGSR